MQSGLGRLRRALKRGVLDYVGNPHGFAIVPHAVAQAAGRAPPLPRAAVQREKFRDFRGSHAPAFGAYALLLLVVP